jgi:hypothetical protein
VASLVERASGGAIVSEKTRGRFDAVLLVLLGISISLNIGLFVHLRNASAGAAAGRAARQAPPTLPTGDVAPVLTGRSLSGESVSLQGTTAQGGLLLYVYSPQCVWCARNEPNLKALATVRARGFRLVGVCLGAASDCRPGEESNFDVALVPSAESHAAYRLASTPQTLVISADNRVERVWTGAYSARIAAEIEQFFGITLPGLDAAARRPVDGPS